MKKAFTIILVIVISLISIGVYYYIENNGENNNTNDNSNYEAERTSVEKNDEQNHSQEQSPEQPQKQSKENQNSPVEAEEIASFTTKIYTKDSNRQNNITITCSTLNDTDVANGSTFSFCDTVGRSSSSKGYKKADIFNNGKKTKGYGGGNCQISTTLYNAVLKVPSIKVTERHEHSNKVPYIQNGKDAAVSFGAYDFKFVNNTGNSIRIKASHTSDSVTIRLVKLL